MLLGLCGKLGSGKDTAADRLEQMLKAGQLGESVQGILFDSQFERISFAAPLKESAAAAINTDVAVLNNFKNDPNVYVGVFVEYEELGFLPYPDKQGLPTVRNYLQRYGTEAHREIFGDDFWVKAALPDGYDHTQKLAVVTDVRFPNELTRVHEVGGWVVQVLGPDGDAEGNHPSEQVLEGYDFVLPNQVRNDGFRTLDKELKALIQKIGANELVTA